MEAQARRNCAISSSTKDGDFCLSSGSICSCSLSQMLALTVADNLRISRVPRTVLLVVAFVLGTAVGSVAVMTSGHYCRLGPRLLV